MQGQRTTLPCRLRSITPRYESLCPHNSSVLHSYRSLPPTVSHAASTVFTVTSASSPVVPTSTLAQFEPAFRRQGPFYFRRCQPFSSECPLRCRLSSATPSISLALIGPLPVRLGYQAFAQQQHHKPTTMQPCHTSKVADDQQSNLPETNQEEQNLSTAVSLLSNGVVCSPKVAADAVPQSALSDHPPASPPEGSKSSSISAANFSGFNRQQRRKDLKAESRQTRRLEAEQRAREAAIKRSEARHKQKCMPFERRDSSTGILAAVRPPSLSHQASHEHSSPETSQGDLSQAVVVFKHPYKYGELLVPAPKSIDQEYVEQLTSEILRLSQALADFSEDTPAYRNMDTQIEMRRVQLEMINQARLHQTQSRQSLREQEQGTQDAHIATDAEDDQNSGALQEQCQHKQPLHDLLLPEDDLHIEDASKIMLQSANKGTVDARAAKAQKNRRKNERKKMAARRAKAQQQQQEKSLQAYPTEGHVKLEDTDGNNLLGNDLQSLSNRSCRLQRRSSFPAAATEVKQQEHITLRQVRSASSLHASAQLLLQDILQTSKTMLAACMAPASAARAAPKVDLTDAPTGGLKTVAASLASKPTAHDAKENTTALVADRQKVSSADTPETAAACVDTTAPIIDTVDVPPVALGKQHDVCRRSVHRKSSSESASSPSLRQRHREHQKLLDDSQDRRSDDGLWVRGISGPCIRVQEEDVVFDRSFSVYGRHVINLVLQKHHQAIEDHHIVEAKDGYLVLEGGFIVQLLDLEGRCEIIGYFPEGSPYHIPLSPLLADEARRRAIHEELQLRQWLSRGAGPPQHDSETDHGYSASEGSLSDEPEDDAERSEESLPPRRLRRLCAMHQTQNEPHRDSQINHDLGRQRVGEGDIGQDNSDGSTESEEYTEDCDQEEDDDHGRFHGELEVLRGEEITRQARHPLEGQQQRSEGRGPHRSPPAYKLPKKLQELKARLAAGRLVEEGSPAPGLEMTASDRRAPHHQVGRLAKWSIGPSPSGQRVRQATSRIKFRIPSSRPAPPAPRLLEGQDFQPRNVIVAEEAPLRKYAGIDAASLPRHKVARSLRSRHFGVRLGPYRGRRQRALVRRDKEQYLPIRTRKNAAPEAVSAQDPVHSDAEHMNMQEATLRALQEALRRSLGITSLDVQDQASQSSHNATQGYSPDSSRVYEIETEGEELSEPEDRRAKGDDAAETVE